MAKELKKQIKRSFPWFMIFSLLLSTFAAGLIFNLDFKISASRDQGLEVSFNKQEAVAQDDTATTSVEVRNAPPEFLVDTAEETVLPHQDTPFSTSTSPVNVGESVGFSATAKDAESNDYKLFVCDSNSITVDASGGESHACGGVEFCSSEWTSATDDSGDEAACVYDNVTDPGAETEEWYAFVCDNHSTQAECSAVNQGELPGTGDDSSPFYVNHAPDFTYTYTSDDNKDPGGTFTVTASSTDSDTADQADEMYMYVCSTDSWATSTGCTATEWCSGTSTTDSIDCSFATTTPAMDDDWSYNVFVKDWHEFAAPANSRTNTYTVNNVAPQVSSVSLNEGSNISVSFRGMPEVEASITGQISDNNVCTDISHATSSVYWSSVTGAYNCSADDDNCYQVGSVDCSMDSGTCTGGSDSNASYTCTTTMAYHAIPTDASDGNPNSGTWWLGAIRAFDDDGATHVDVSPDDAVDVEGTVALHLSEEEVPYGVVRGGMDTGDYNATTTTWNYGNVPLDNGIEGADMVKDDASGEVIEVWNQTYELSTFTYPGSWTLTSTSTEQRDITAPKPTTASPDVYDEMYWGIAIPAGKSSGNYYGSTTFQAIVDGDDW